MSRVVRSGLTACYRVAAALLVSGAAVFTSGCRAQDRPAAEATLDTAMVAELECVFRQLPSFAQFAEADSLPLLVANGRVVRRMHPALPACALTGRDRSIASSRFVPPTEASRVFGPAGAWGAFEFRLR